MNTPDSLGDLSDKSTGSTSNFWYLPSVLIFLLGIALSIFVEQWAKNTNEERQVADFTSRATHYSTFMNSDLVSTYTEDNQTFLNESLPLLGAKSVTEGVIRQFGERSITSDWLNASVVWIPWDGQRELEGPINRDSIIASPELEPVLSSFEFHNYVALKESLELAAHRNVGVAFGHIAGDDDEGHNLHFLHLQPVYETANELLLGHTPDEPLKGFIGVSTQTTMVGIGNQIPMSMGGIEAFLIQQPEDQLEGWESSVTEMENEALLKLSLINRSGVQTGEVDWALLALPNDEFFAGRGSLSSSGIISIGCLISLVLALYLGQIQNRSVRVQKMIQERTKDLEGANVQLAMEVSQHKQTADALLVSEKKYRLLAENVSDIIWTFDADWNCTYVSPSVLEIRGFTQDEAEAQQLTDSLTPDSHQKVQDTLADIASRVADEGLHSYPYTLELEMYHKDGSTIWTESRTNVLLNEEETELIGFLGVTRDISQRKKDEAEKASLESQLRQSQKMEAIGVLAGGVAHDFNNLLTGILGYASLMKNKYSDNEDLVESAEVIETAAQRAADLTKQLLGFARQGKLQNTQVDLTATITETTSLLERTLDKGIELSYSLNAKNALVLGDPSQLQLVVLNLAVNARDAMPSGGQLEFTTKCVEIDHAFCRAHVEAQPGNYVCLSVADSGTGIDSETRERIFDPFFTTKKNGKGTGMGLATVYGIVKNHGGFLVVDSKVDNGTTFHVYFPESKFKGAVPVSLDSSEPIRGEGSILVVDDEDVVQRIAKRMLSWLGYDVVVTCDGIEAVEYYEKNQETIDLVLIDMVMPRMSGRECFLALKQINPNVRAVLCTGYSRDGMAQEILDDEGMKGFVQKPYHALELSEVIAKALQ